jgi:hypothetical protein
MGERHNGILYEEIDDPASRWIVCPKEMPASNSGKTVFKCRVCGRLSVTPDKACNDPMCEKWTPPRTTTGALYHSSGSGKGARR